MLPISREVYIVYVPQLGFLISRNQTFMEKVERLGQARLGAQPLAQAIGIAALELPESYYEEIRTTYQGRIEALLAGLDDIGEISCHRPEGAFYLMCRLPVDDAERFARYLAADFEYEGESLVVAPGPGFYATPGRGRDLIRLAAVAQEEKLHRAMGLLKRALQQYPGRLA